MKRFLATSERYGRRVWKLSGDFLQFLNPSSPSVSYSRLQIFAFLYCLSCFFYSHPALSKSLNILPAPSLFLSGEWILFSFPFIYSLSYHPLALTYCRLKLHTDTQIQTPTPTFSVVFTMLSPVTLDFLCPAPAT